MLPLDKGALSKVCITGPLADTLPHHYTHPFTATHSGTVLLKNDLMTGSSTPMLPLDKGALSKVCITGPLADSAEHMMGNYYGKWDSEAALTPKKAIKDELGECCNGIDPPPLEVQARRGNRHVRVLQHVVRTATLCRAADTQC
jgi:hypothetical protein